MATGNRANRGYMLFYVITLVKKFRRQWVRSIYAWMLDTGKQMLTGCAVRSGRRLPGRAAHGRDRRKERKLEAQSPEAHGRECL